jgi:Calcineurin-like phosphoesterase
VNKLPTLPLAVGITLTLAGLARTEVLKFGLIADTQWPAKASITTTVKDANGTVLKNSAGKDSTVKVTVNADSLSGYRNPKTVAVDILRQVDKEFIAKGAKFVIAVGDITDDGAVAGMDVRATWAQELYNAGIGFFPLRGNHEDEQAGANTTEFLHVFPQTRDGVQNKTPLDAFNWTDSAVLHPALPGATPAPFTVGSGFTSPSVAMNGLSYAFSVGNANFVLLDQFRPVDSTISNAIDSQLVWIDTTLAKRPTGNHAFVLGHKGLITENHADNLFGSDPSKDTSGTNRFIRSLAKNGVRYYMGGHDHIHNRSLVATTNDSTVRVQDIILGSDSYKFYTPVAKSVDSTYNLPAFGRLRQTQLAQELYQITYSIVTVDGPRVTVECWGVPAAQVGGGITSVPDLTGKWTLRERYGYSLNGKEFVVNQGASFSGIADSGLGTKAAILGGTNTDTARDYSKRAVVKQVGTGWSEALGAASAQLTLWGLQGIGSEQTPTFALSLSYDTTKVSAADLKTGKVALSRAVAGTWQNATQSNFGGTSSFVLRAWTSTDTLGTWGIDTVTHTAWAVLNRAGDLAVAALGGATGIAKASNVRDAARLNGHVLELPSRFLGKSTTVEVLGLDGRTVSSLRTESGRIDLSSLHGHIFLVRCRASGTASLEQKVAIAR